MPQPAFVNVDPADGSTTTAYSRADLAWSPTPLTFNTDADGYSPLIAHGLGTTPMFASCSVTAPLGGGNNLPGPIFLATCDASNIQFRFMANDGNITGTVRANKSTTIVWFAIAP